MTWGEALILWGLVAAIAAVVVGVHLGEQSAKAEWQRKSDADCHWRGYRTATVRCYGTGTPFDQDGGVRERCVMVTTGYRMDGMTVEAGKWSLPRAACSVEWSR